MGVESSTTIQGLDASWPLSGDRRSEGDDHIRLIKAVLKAAFPGEDGLGFNVPIIAKEADLNAAFTAGVKTVFYMATAPIGWTISNPGTNYTLVSADTGGVVGGGAGRNDNIVSGCTAVPDHFHGQQGTFVSNVSNQSLSHTHTINGGNSEGLSGASFFNGVNGGGAQNFFVRSSGIVTLANTLADLTSHNHNVTLSGNTTTVTGGSGSTNAIGAWQPLYASVIIASRN